MALFNKNEINISPKILELINRRRRQILVHSYLYYKCDTNLISDFTFDSWCKELFKLQKQYPRETEKAVFQEAFKNWTGFSGYDLFSHDNMTEAWARFKALQLDTFYKNNKNNIC